ncbi:MAG: hypothetical protein OEY09_10400 [Gammaproteobacteria bacterium]|nr:hypothetical protein [Gammaproteobacteria bacterium]
MIKNADDALTVNQGNVSGSDTPGTGGQDDQESPKENQAKPDSESISGEDAKEISQILVNGLFGLVEKVAPITYEPATKEKGAEVYTPLIEKYGPKVFPLFGKNFSLVKFYREFGAEIKAAYFTVEVVVGSYHAIREEKLKEADHVEEEETDKK